MPARSHAKIGKQGNAATNLRWSGSFIFG